MNRRDYDPSLEVFCRTVRRLRRESGLTEREFARRVGLSLRSVSLIENGHRGTSAVYAVAIARELGTTVEGLFGLEAT